MFDLKWIIKRVDFAPRSNFKKPYSKLEQKSKLAQKGREKERGKS